MIKPLIVGALAAAAGTCWIAGVMAAQDPSAAQKVQAARTASDASRQLTATGQAYQTNRPYGVLQLKNAATRTGDPQALQSFVDEIFVQTGFAGTATSVRERVARAERLYREGRQKPVALDTLVTAVNRLASDLPVPKYFRTSRSQLLMQELYVQAHAPHGLWDEDDNPEALAPSEAIFFTLFLTYQKFFNPTYQMDPDLWAARQRKLIANHPSRDFLRLRTRLKADTSHVGQYATMRAELANEHSDMTEAAHSLLDRMGLTR